jgi:hypothetical protein
MYTSLGIKTKQKSMTGWAVVVLELLAELKEFFPFTFFDAGQKLHQFYVK